LGSAQCRHADQERRCGGHDRQQVTRGGGVQRPGRKRSERASVMSIRCQRSGGTNGGASRFIHRVITTFCGSVYFSSPSGPCLRPTPDCPIPPIGAAVVPQAGAYPSSMQTVPVDRKSTRLNSSHVKTSYAVF